MGINRIVLLFCFCSGLCIAGETGHYINGVEGVKAASLPPPGFYYRMYNAYYSSDRLKDHRGEKDSRYNEFEIMSRASSHRFLYLDEREIEFLGGAHYGVDVAIPLVSTDFHVSGFSPLVGPFDLFDREEGVSDIYVEPLLLGWYGKQWDFAVGYAFYAPTGEYDVDEPASLGKNFWTHMLTIGGTIFESPNKRFHASVLARYEIHTEKEDAWRNPLTNVVYDVTPGDDFHFEWGVGTTFMKAIDVGLCGYAHWQVTDDEGDAIDDDPTRLYGDPDVHDRVFAAGPEVAVFVPDWNMQFAFRYLKEFKAEDRQQGYLMVLTLTFVF